MYSILLRYEEITISAENLHYELELAALCGTEVTVFQCLLKEKEKTQDQSPAGLITPNETSKPQPAPSKHAKVCNGELWREIRFPLQQSWRKPAVFHTLLSNHKHIASSSSLPSFLSLHPLFILSGALYSLHTLFSCFAAQRGAELRIP